MSPPKPPTNEIEPGVRIIAGERYYTIARFAAEINRTTRTVQRWYEQGFGPPRTKIGGLDLIPESRIAGWLASHTREQMRPSRNKIRRTPAASAAQPDSAPALVARSRE